MNDRLGRVCVIRPTGRQPFALIGTDQGNETYIVDDDSDVGEMLVGAPCGCMVCDEQIQSGHFACSCPTPALLAAERAGAIWRAYTDGGWQWFLVSAEGRLKAAQRQLNIAATDDQRWSSALAALDVLTAEVEQREDEW